MSIRIVQLCFVAAAAVVLCSCSGSPEYGKKTYPVKGEVYVDGQPAGALKITLHDVNGFDTANPTFSSTMTEEDGTFAVSTFEAGDGVPAGEYTATFEWGTLNVMTKVYEKDKLKGRYMDPKKSETHVTVTEGQPTDMGRIELTTK